MNIEKMKNEPSEIMLKNENGRRTFDPDKRIDASENARRIMDKDDKFDPDKRMKISNIHNESSDSSGIKQAQAKDATDSSNNTETTEQQNPHEEVRDGKTYYYDAKGNLYRVDNDLVPNNQYEINSYKYETDENGRIISAEGDLHLKDRDGRLPIKDSIEDVGKGDQKATDDRGHLIGDQFDGSNRLENLVPQDANINRNDFKNFENELAKEVKDGKTVHVKVEPVYDGDSHRPSAIVVTYSIDGEESVRVFPNDKEEQ